VLLLVVMIPIIYPQINDAIPDNIRYYEEVDSTCYISSIRYFTSYQTVHVLRISNCLTKCFFHSPSRNFSQFPDVTLYFEGGAPLTMRPVDYLLRQGFSTVSTKVLWCYHQQFSWQLHIWLTNFGWNWMNIISHNYLQDLVEDILCVGFQNSKWLQGLEHTTILGG
jgi:hypothetical protein